MLPFWKKTLSSIAVTFQKSYFFTTYFFRRFTISQLLFLSTATHPIYRLVTNWAKCQLLQLTLNNSDTVLFRFLSDKILLRVLSDRALFKYWVIGSSSGPSEIDSSLGSSVLFFGMPLFFDPNMLLLFLIKNRWSVLHYTFIKNKMKKYMHDTDKIIILKIYMSSIFPILHKNWIKFFRNQIGFLFHFET